MPIIPTLEDVGRRVVYAPASKTAAIADQMHGVLSRVWDGIPYIKYDWQPANAPPIPESPNLLTWDDPAEETSAQVGTDQDDESFVAGVVMGAVIGSAGFPDEPAPDDTSDIQAAGGSFGGGGATAEWSDPTPDSDDSSDDGTGGGDE